MSYLSTQLLSYQLKNLKLTSGNLSNMMMFPLPLYMSS